MNIVCTYICHDDRVYSQVYIVVIIIVIIIIIIMQSVLRQFFRLFQIKLTRECDLMLSLSVSIHFSFPNGFQQMLTSSSSSRHFNILSSVFPVITCGRSSSYSRCYFFNLRRMFLSSQLCNTSSFFARSAQRIFSVFPLQHYISKLLGISDILTKMYALQHSMKLCTKCGTSLVSYLS